MVKIAFIKKIKIFCILIFALNTGTIFAGDVFDYVPDSFFSKRHTKTFRLSGFSLSKGTGFTTDKRNIDISSFQLCDVYEIFPSNSPFNSFWSSFDLEYMNDLKEKKGLYNIISWGFSTGPFFRLKPLWFLKDWRLYAGPLIRTVLYFNYDDIEEVDDPPFFGILGGFKTGAEFFAGRNLTFNFGIKWIFGQLYDIFHFLESADKLRNSKNLNVFEFYIGTKFFLNI